MTDSPANTEKITELLVYLGRAARGTDAGSDLTAAQWTVLSDKSEPVLFFQQPQSVRLRQDRATR